MVYKEAHIAHISYQLLSEHEKEEVFFRSQHELDVAKGIFVF